MPRKSKEKNEELNIEKTNTKKKSTATKKGATSRKSNIAKKETTNKKTATAEEKKTVATKKAPNKTRATKKASSKVTVAEYYDLPFRYNQTIVKVLAQTPTTLFVYWDISDKDRKMYIDKYGEDFFEKTRPYLIITNETMNYKFEVEINDFANSWYLHINDADCKYKVELIRKFNSNPSQDVYVSSSNEMDSPNNHILFDSLKQNVFFKNIKTNIVEERNISSISFLQRIGKVYNIYEMYKKMYGDDITNSSPTFK